MRLNRYLSENDITVAGFQVSIGARSRNTVYRYLRDGHVPEPLSMRRIFLATGGQVTPNDFYDFDAWRAELGAGEAAA